MEEEKREYIIKKLVEKRWSENSVVLGIRANFKCEYCDRDLLASVNDYKEWQFDHIVPLSAGGIDESENIAVSCRTCNVNVKSRWNPMGLFKDSEKPSREQLIAVTRDYVKKKRAELLDEVSYFNSIVNGLK